MFPWRGCHLSFICWEKTACLRSQFEWTTRQGSIMCIFFLPHSTRNSFIINTHTFSATRLNAYQKNKSVECSGKCSNFHVLRHPIGRWMVPFHFQLQPGFVYTRGGAKEIAENDHLWSSLKNNPYIYCRLNLYIYIIYIYFNSVSLIVSKWPAYSIYCLYTLYGLIFHNLFNLIYKLDKVI